MEAKENSLTSPSDWDGYYESRSAGDRLPPDIQEVVSTELLSADPGEIFELGCGGSIVLRSCAEAGWKVSGIDFNRKAVDGLSSSLGAQKLPFGDLIHGDVHRYDCSLLGETYDTLFSIGFLEHFRRPEQILDRWARVVKQGGKVLSIIPNLFSFNALLLRKYSRAHWDQHRTISPLELDGMHLAAGLAVESPARYKGGFDVDMFIPWSVIRQKLRYPLLLALARHGSCLVVRNALDLVFHKNSRFVSPIIYGIYRKS
jgi:SAM-dependent methyltransferase